MPDKPQNTVQANVDLLNFGTVVCQWWLVTHSLLIKLLIGSENYALLFCA